MKDLFKPGDSRLHRYQVTEADIARFESGVVHRVCSTFALAREMEWSSRLFVLEMKDADEEGIGTMLEIEHRGPAFPDEWLEITAIVEELRGHELLCTIRVETGGRLVATGRTGQKIIRKEKLARLLAAGAHEQRQGEA